LSTRYSDVVFFSDRIEAEQVKRAKANLIDQAFGAWLELAYVHGYKKGFSGFLNSLGLGEKKVELKPEQRAAMIDKANKIAERILKMYKKKPAAKKVKGNGKKNI